MESATGKTTSRRGDLSISRSHPGLRRTANEDRILERPEAGLWAVADGMGGHEGGAAAATKVLEAVATVADGVSGHDMLLDLVQRLTYANQQLFGTSTLSGQKSTTGSTVVVLLFNAGHFACLWAGDSRAYLLRHGDIKCITRDHSVVQEMIDAGVMRDSDRARHPQRNVITRAIGGAAHTELEQRFGAICEGDVFLLCSDGLTSCVSDDEIAHLMAKEDIEGVGHKLLTLALERGAPDNVSYIIVRPFVGQSKSCRV